MPDWRALLKHFAAGAVEPARSLLDRASPRRPSAPADARRNVIVVGSDGSDHAADAVEAGAELAATRTQRSKSWPRTACCYPIARSWATSCATPPRRVPCPRHETLASMWKRHLGCVPASARKTRPIGREIRPRLPRARAVLELGDEGEQAGK